MLVPHTLIRTNGLFGIISSSASQGMNFSTKNPHYSFVRQGFDLAITLCSPGTGWQGGRVPVSP